MVSDVYAGDSDQPAAVAPTSVIVDARFRINADTDPTALARIAGILSLANTAPCEGSIATMPTGQLAIVLELRELPQPVPDLILRKLAQLTCVIGAECEVVERSATRDQFADTGAA